MAIRARPPVGLHFAGSVSVPESMADPLSYYLNNTSNSRSLITAAEARFLTARQQRYP
jgi:UDP-glucose 4-epimerase